jgi:transposase
MDTETDIIYTQEEAKRFFYEATRLAYEVELMREEIRLLRAKRFGASSERTELSGQGILFNEAEASFVSSSLEPAIEKVIVQRKKRPHGKRELDLSLLPIRRIDYEIKEDERICPECFSLMHEMGIDIRREIEYVPARYEVVEHAVHIYACRNCQKEAEHTPIIKAAAPLPLFFGSLASASLLAQVLCDKYLYHLPLYRQQAAFANDGLDLSRQTLANWVIRASEDWLYGIYDHLKQELVLSECIHVDETTLEVLKEPDRKATQKSYMWLYQSAATERRQVVLFDYRQTRSHEHPKLFLEDFSGYCHADGYSGYHKLPGNIRIVGCWAHARRKFDEALKATPVDKRSESLAAAGLAYINALFDLERDFAKMDPNDRYLARLKQSVPVVEELYGWARNTSALPKSLVGRAIHYLNEQREYLMRVFEDGRCDLSNNRAERSIKPFVCGRKNWLFSNTPRGAFASAVIFSIIQTAKENRLSVYEYLKYLFEQLPNASSSQIESLLPWSQSLPLYVKVPTTAY